VGTDPLIQPALPLSDSSFIFVFLLAVFFALGSYFEATGSYTVGTVIAHGYVALTNAVVSGAVLSMTAAATLTVSAVRLPSSGVLSLSGPSYTTPVSLLRASSFAVLAASAVTNTVRCDAYHFASECIACMILVGSCAACVQGPSTVVGNLGCYPNDMTPPSPAGLTLIGINYGSTSTSSDAQTDAATVYASLVARASVSSTPIAAVMDSTRRFPGVYTCM
jgi:hypothetical protein